jgi:hypothetical protein
MGWQDKVLGCGLGLAFLTSWAKLHIASLCPLLSSSWKISVVLLFSVSGLESRHWHVIGCSSTRRVLQDRVSLGAVIDRHGRDCRRSGELVHAAQTGVWTA